MIKLLTLLTSTPDVDAFWSGMTHLIHMDTIISFGKEATGMFNEVTKNPGKFLITPNPQNIEIIGSLDKLEYFNSKIEHQLEIIHEPCKQISEGINKKLQNITYYATQMVNIINTTCPELLINFPSNSEGVINITQVVKNLPLEEAFKNQVNPVNLKKFEFYASLIEVEMMDLHKLIEDYPDILKIAKKTRVFKKLIFSKK